MYAWYLLSLQVKSIASCQFLSFDITITLAASCRRDNLAWSLLLLFLLPSEYGASY